MSAPANRQGAAKAARMTRKGVKNGAKMRENGRNCII
jgi:hypothetical protein